MSRHKVEAKLGWMLVAVLAFAACDRGPSPEVQAQLDGLQAQRDSLTQVLAEREAYVQSLARQIDEAIAEMGGEAVTPENLGDRIGMLRTELTNARTQVEEARQRVGSLNRRSTSLRDSLAAVTQRADQALAAQRDSIARLVATTGSMQTRIGQLTEQGSSLEASLATLERQHYAAYFAVGTKDELLEQGVVAEVGGARVLLLLWRAGETLVPARTLDTEHFEAIDVRETTTLELPAAGTYRVVSRHDTRYLQPTPDRSGRFTGQSLRITDPAEFWSFSPYLILVREN